MAKRMNMNGQSKQKATGERAKSCAASAPLPSAPRRLASMDIASFTGALMMWCETHQVHYLDDARAKHGEQCGEDSQFFSCGTGKSQDTYATCGGKGKPCAMKGYKR